MRELAASVRCISAAAALHEAELHRSKDEPVGERDAVHDAARVFPIEVRIDAQHAGVWPPESEAVR
jgi:hypothetical protein